MSKWTLHIFPIVFGFLRTFTIIVDLRRSKKVSEVYRVLAVEGSEARREQEKGGMLIGVNKSVAPACVKIGSCVCPSCSYEMFPRSVKLQLAKMRLHFDIFRHKFMLNFGSLGFCCLITTLTCRGQHPWFYSLSFILFSRVHISVSSLACTVSAPLSFVYRP